MHQYEEAYREILRLYDIAEELVETAEQEHTNYPAQQIDLLEPVVETVIAAADELSEEFCMYADASDKKKASKKFDFSKKFKRIFGAVNKCLGTIQQMPAEMAENIVLNIRPAMESLVKQAEKIFTKLIGLVEAVKVTVERRRQEFHDMVMREAHIASMMRQQVIHEALRV